jgi:hypothetical protein
VQGGGIEFVLKSKFKRIQVKFKPFQILTD